MQFNCLSYLSKKIIIIIHTNSLLIFFTFLEYFHSESLSFYYATIYIKKENKDERSLYEIKEYVKFTMVLTLGIMTVIIPASADNIDPTLTQVILH